MRIVPPPEFWHAGDLTARFDSLDPRDGAFAEPEVIVDLRGCDFVRPAAVLWCTVYPLLVQRKGCKCAVWVPTNMGVCSYLKSIGLFRALREGGVEVDDRGIADRRNPKVVLSLSRFDSESEAESLTNKANDALRQSRLGAANLYSVVSETFGELAINAVQHAESPVGAYGLIQFYGFANSRKFVCVVADGGIGIRRSLEKNPMLRDRVPYDWAAVELATRERVSGTLDPMRGIGLYGVAEDMRKPGRNLIIHSGIGSLEISERIESRAVRTRLFPGTLAYASIPT